MKKEDEILFKHIKGRFRIRSADDNMPILARPLLKLKARVALSKLINDLGFTKGVEIGVRRGGSAMIWCEYNPELHLTCIDPWIGYHQGAQDKQDKRYQMAVDNLKNYNVEIIRKKSMDAISAFEDRSLDFVHIDGHHDFDYCAPDIIYWAKKVRHNGLVLVHDYTVFQWAGVMKAVDAYTHCHRIDPWYLADDRIFTAFWRNDESYHR